MPITVHIGYDDHVSGFELQDEDLENLAHLTTHDDVNSYIINNCERVEVNESDLFFNNMDMSVAEFDEFIDDVCFWIGLDRSKI